MTTEELLAMCDRITNGITKTVKTNATEYSRDPDKFCFGLQEPYELAVALRTTLTDVERLTKERDEAMADYDEEYAIVERIWKALGISNYEQTGGKSIYEHVAALRQRVPEPCGLHAKCLELVGDWRATSNAMSEADGDGPYRDTLRRCAFILAAILKQHTCPPPAGDKGD